MNQEEKEKYRVGLVYAFHLIGKRIRTMSSLNYKQSYIIVLEEFSSELACALFRIDNIECNTLDSITEMINYK